MTINLTNDEAATILESLYASRPSFAPESAPAIEDLIGRLGGIPLEAERYYLVTVTTADGTTLYPTGTGTMFRCDSKARVFDDQGEAERFAGELGEGAEVIERVRMKREKFVGGVWSLGDI